MTRRRQPSALSPLAADTAATIRLEERFIAFMDRYERDQVLAADQRKAAAERMRNIETALEPLQNLQEKQRWAWWALGLICTLLAGTVAFLDKIANWVFKS